MHQSSQGRAALLRPTRAVAASPIRGGQASPSTTIAATPAAAAAAGLPAQLRLMLTIGTRVIVRGSLDELTGWMTERFTYADGSHGAFVELDSGNVIRVPLRELDPIGGGAQ